MITMLNENFINNPRYKAWPTYPRDSTPFYGYGFCISFPVSLCGIVLFLSPWPFPLLQKSTMSAPIRRVWYSIHGHHLTRSSDHIYTTGHSSLQCCRHSHLSASLPPGHLISSVADLDESSLLIPLLSLLFIRFEALAIFTHPGSCIKSVASNTIHPPMTSNCISLAPIFPSFWFVQ